MTCDEHIVTVRGLFCAVVWQGFTAGRSVCLCELCAGMTDPITDVSALIFHHTSTNIDPCFASVVYLYICCHLSPTVG